jgi:hypothetical protein
LKLSLRRPAFYRSSRRRCWIEFYGGIEFKDIEEYSIKHAEISQRKQRGWEAERRDHEWARIERALEGNRAIVHVRFKIARSTRTVIAIWGQTRESKIKRLKHQNRTPR